MIAPIRDNVNAVLQKMGPTGTYFLLVSMALLAATPAVKAITLTTFVSFSMSLVLGVGLVWSAYQLIHHDKPWADLIGRLAGLPAIILLGEFILSLLDIAFGFAMSEWKAMPIAAVVSFGWFVTWAWFDYEQEGLYYWFFPFIFGIVAMLAIQPTPGGVISAIIITAGVWVNYQAFVRKRINLSEAVINTLRFWPFLPKR